MICNEVVHLNADNKVLIEVLDGRTIRITFDAHPFEVIEEKKKIVGINVSGIPYLHLNDYNKVFITVNDRLHTYVIKEIDRIGDNCFQLHTMKRTKSSFFITPIIGENRISVRWNQYFVNTFLTDENTIVILFRFFNSDDYKQFEHSVSKHPLFEKIIDFDAQHVAMQFKVPEEHVNNVKLFRDGQYSKMSNSYKLQILKFHSLAKDSLIGKILFKADERRKQIEMDLGVAIPPDIELYDKPDERELFKKEEDAKERTYWVTCS